MPRVAFVGLGWIGLNRMRAVVETGLVDVVAVSDPSAEAVEGALALAPGAVAVTDLNEALALQPDGVVIATPSAMHAAQTIRALEAGAAVFCQKPLGRNAAEARAAVEAARAADRLLEVDLSYRGTAAMQALRPLVQGGELGRIFAVDLTFHNAWGPDKPWFYDKAQSGGGCVMDLGVHLVDLALWSLDFPEVARVSARLFANGLPLAGDAVEDFAVVTLDLADGTVVRLACSWNLQAGTEAVIAAEFHGTEGGAAFRNVSGSFYDFTAQRHRRTEAEVLVLPPDPWGGRMASDWARRLAAGEGFDPEAERLVAVAEVLDRIYETASG